MTKITLSSLANLQNEDTAVSTINSNSDTLVTAFDNTLSRDGTTPNQMTSNLDMNSNQILNLPAPVSSGSPARLIDVISNPTLALTIPPVGTSGATVPLLNTNVTFSGNNTFSGTNTFTGVNVYKGSITSNSLNTFSQLSGSSGTASGITDLALYQEIFPGVTMTNNVSSVLDIPASSSPVAQNALAGFIRNKSGGGGTAGNGVALFGVGTAETANTATWGINTLLQDSSTRAIGSVTGIIIKNEFDFDVMNPGTVVQGISVSGNSLAQPTSSVGFQVASLGTGIIWEIGLETVDAACGSGIVLGSLGTTANSYGQPVYFNYRDGSNVSRFTSLQSQGGFLVLAGGTGFAGLNVSGGNIFCSKAISCSNPAFGIGYSTGAGGTVTQATSKSTGVTLNTVTGQITMNNANLATNGVVSFTVTNSTVTATDNIILSLVSGEVTAASYTLTTHSIANGSFSIALRNQTGGGLTEALVINFAVIKGVTS